MTMTPKTAADRLRRAELEFRLSMEEHTHDDLGALRYWAARRELQIAWAVAHAVLEAAERAGSVIASRGRLDRGFTHF